MSVHCSSCDRRVAYLAGKAGGEGGMEEMMGVV
jgi:hypothetical protein